MIQYKIGDATTLNSNTIIAHICNDIGAWGSGFVLALNRRFGDLPKVRYRNWYKNRRENDFDLGSVQFVTVDDMKIANMVAQHLVGRDENGGPCIRYDALASCLDKLSQEALVCNSKVQMPRIGTDRAGGSWDIISELIESNLCDNGVEVVVYDLP